MKKQVLVLVFVLTAFSIPFGWSLGQLPRGYGQPYPDRPPTIPKGTAHSIPELRGQVTLPDGRRAAPDTQVDLISNDGTATTHLDSKGKFKFTVPKPGVYALNIYVAGKLECHQEIDVRPESDKFVDIVLGTRDNIPENARKNFWDAQQLLTQGKDVDRATELLEKAIQQYPRYADAYLSLGTAYRSQTNLTKAEESLQKAVELNKLNADAYIALGSVQNDEKKYAEAEKSLLTAIVTSSAPSADAQFELGRACFGLGRWEAAGQHVGTANQLRPDNPKQHVMMGNILLRERNADGALKEFREALRLDPTGPNAEAIGQMITRIEAVLKQQAADQRRTTPITMPEGK